MPFPLKLNVLGPAIAGLAAVWTACGGEVSPTSLPAHVSTADFLRSDRFLLGKPDVDILNADLAFQWIDEGEWFHYRSQRVGVTRYWLVKSASGEKQPLFDHRVMAAVLAAALGIPVDYRALPIDRVSRLGQGRYQVDSKGKTFGCDLTAQVCNEHDDASDPTAMPSPDGRYTLLSRDYDLWLKDNRTGSERALTTDGVRGWSYGRAPESSTSEISNRRSGKQLAVAALWAPDSRRFVSYRLDERHVAELALLQAIPEDGSFRPKVHTYHYDLPGEKPSEAAFFIYDVQTDTRTAIDYAPLPATYRVPLASGHLWWSEDASKLYLIDSPVDAARIKLLEVDPRSGSTRALMEERAEKTYFTNALYLGPPSIRVLRNGDIIWFSERDGWGHLYRYEGATGKLKNAITQGEWLVRDIQRIEERSGYVYFTANGRERGEDLYNRHLYRVRLDGTGLQLLTPQPADHDFPAVPAPEIAAMSGAGKPPVPRISPNGAYIIDHFSTPDAPGQWILRSRDGAVIAELEREDPSPLPPYTAPEPFVVKSADGRYDLYGVLSKPASFDPSRKYPVIDSIYPGPQIIKAPKTFAAAILGDAQALADLGFVVVQVDGRGGPLRSKAFRDESYANMDKAGTLEDHVSALRQLAATRPWMDLERVGIFGTSGGGFATAHALIDHPEFFKVGVACVGNYEQRAYLRNWGETFHGPASSTDYDKVFPGRDVSRFKGKLLVGMAELDDNVHPANTLRLVDALIKGNKQFDMLVMPNVNHGMGGNAYFRRILQNYFLRHLMRAQLPSEVDIVLPGSGKAP